MFMLRLSNATEKGSVLVFFYIFLESVLQNYFDSLDQRTEFEKFWDDYGGFVIMAAIVVAIVLFFVIRSFVLRMVENKRERMVEMNGVKVDPFKMCTVNLMGADSVTIPKNSIFAAPLPEKEGYLFQGWFYDSACTIPYVTVKLKQSITLYPKWVPKN